MHSSVFEISHTLVSAAKWVRAGNLPDWCYQSVLRGFRGLVRTGWGQTYRFPANQRNLFPQELRMLHNGGGNTRADRL